MDKDIKSINLLILLFKMKLLIYIIMYITTDNIYCAQWLVNETLKNYCKKKKYNSYYIKPHDIVHIKDTINYRALFEENFDMYNHYVTVTKQKEHSVENYKKLIENFDVNKLNKIKVRFNSHINKFIVCDGVHRLSILLFKNIIKDKIPFQYLDIV